MTLTEIGGRLQRPRGTYFRRRRPWGAHFAPSGNIPSTPGQTDLTRRWAHGPANYYYHYNDNHHSDTIFINEHYLVWLGPFAKKIIGVIVTLKGFAFLGFGPRILTSFCFCF